MRSESLRKIAVRAVDFHPAMVFAVLLEVSIPAFAGDERHFSIVSGMDATSNSISGYGGGVWAPFNPIDQPGLRLKAIGGHGSYSYQGDLPLAGGLLPVEFRGELIFGELLAGRLWRSGEWTLKAYGGLQYANHSIAPNDPGNSVQGAQWGAKGQVEIWRNLGASNWPSIDGSYATTFGNHWFQTRLGRRFNRYLTLGLEIGSVGNREYDAGRGGAFLRAHLKAFDITFSGGATGDYLGREVSPYLSLGLYHKR